VLLAFKLNRLSANATLDHMKNHQAWSSKAVLGPVLPAILATVIFAVFGRGVMINRKQSIGLILSLLLCLALHGFGAELKNQEPAKILPVPGEVFEFHGHIAFLIPPRQTTNAIPWVWYAPTLPDLPGAAEKWMFEQFTRAGIAIAGIDVGESYGSPKGRAVFTAFYEELVRKRGFSEKPCLLARSRGGLMLYNWAVEHPQSVAGIAGIYPVCDLSSYPGIKNACQAYDMTEQQLANQLAANNPIDRVESLAKARVPIFHIHGDSDKVVPLEKNSGALAQHYRSLGGQMTLRIIKGQGHNMWPGWFQCQELVDFVIANAAGKTNAAGQR
jgi:predicted esterase